MCLEMFQCMALGRCEDDEFDVGIVVGCALTCRMDGRGGRGYRERGGNRGGMRVSVIRGNDD